MNPRLEVLSLLSEFPLLIPLNDYKEWQGYIGVKEHQFKARINVPNYPSLNGISWEFHPQIEKELLNHKSKLINSKSLIDFLQLFQQIVHNTISEKTSLKSEITTSVWNGQSVLFYKQLLDGLEKSIGSCKIDEIGCDMKWVRICYRDSKCSTHFITLSLEGCNKHNSITSFKIIQHDLPNEAVSVLLQDTSFNHFFAKFEEVIESLVPFWDLCKNLEEKTWVIEPNPPKKSDVHRRIYLAEDLSVTLKLNPFDITSLPDVKFLGAIDAVNQARDKFQSFLEMYDGWDSELTLLENLERLLDIKQFVNKKYIENVRLKAGDTGCANA
uniref:WD-3 domain-containing protein n=1 Tax=Rhodnius prolixus TaxID=13249 RepID=T1IC63_RHOPR